MNDIKYPNNTLFFTAAPCGNNSCNKTKKEQEELKYWTEFQHPFMVLGSLEIYHYHDWPFYIIT